MPPRLNEASLGPSWRGSRARPKTLASVRFLLLALLPPLLVLAGERLAGWLWPLPDHLAAPPASSCEVLAADGTVLRVTTTAEGERCLPQPLAGLGLWLPAAVLTGEDRAFHQHRGVDGRAVLRAVWLDLTRLRRVSGASTLTMQVARLHEPRAKNLVGKLAEMWRARQIERHWGKSRILQDYLNRVYWGRQIRGAEAASRYYCQRSASDLSPAQAAALAALLPAPSRLVDDRADWRRRRNRILTVWVEQGLIEATVLNDPLPEAQPWPWLAPHACELALRTPGSTRRQTSIVPAMQLRLEEVLGEQRLAPDGLAVVVVRRASAECCALVGSSDPNLIAANDALAWRGAGSTLKPFLHQAAVDQGLVEAHTLVDDAPARFGDWTPANADGGFLGLLPAAEALARSRNLPAVRLLAGLGLLRFAQELDHLGLRAPAHRPLHLDAALGTSGASPLALAQAYARWADHSQETLQALRRLPLDPTRPGPGPAWKTGTSHGRRDAWCVVLTDALVVVVWLGRRDGRSHPDCLGTDLARPLAAQVVAALEAGVGRG